VNSQSLPQLDRDASSRWLKPYYLGRAVVAAAWFVTAFIVGKTSPAVASALLIAYPAYDAIANLIDAQRSGGVKPSSSQGVNVVISLVAAVAVGVALKHDMHAVIGVFGGWAIVAGLLQLATGVRRWKIGAQWAQVLAGGQSALVGAYFIKQALGTTAITILDIAPYAAFGALYFLISTIWLTVSAARRRAAARA
jgi:uncharacterized membrane protein HdeD (DUF308 family)